MLAQKILLAALAGAIAHAAQAQTNTLQPPVGVPPSLEVQRLAPQLVPFAGSQANFESLVNGLALGSPVTLTTVEPSGLAQSVSFTLPGTTLGSPVEIARALESVRQQLISTGIAAPTAQQLGFALTGSAVPVTFSSTTALPGAGPGAGATGGAIGAAPAAAGVTLPSPAEQLQERAPAPRINTSDTRLLGNISDTPVPATPSVVAPPPTPPTLEAPAAASPASPPALPAPPTAIRRDR